MGTDTYCAYNLTRNVVLSSKVTVADAAHDPLKTLVLMVDGLGVDSKSALWLKPLSAAPEVPRIFSFDIVYLDRSLRAVETTEVVPGVDIPAYKEGVASALILAEGTLSATSTLPGDQFGIEDNGEEDKDKSDAAHLPHATDIAGISVTQADMPSRYALDEEIAREIVKARESPLEPFPSPLIYIPASDSLPAQSMAPFMEVPLSPPEAGKPSPPFIKSKEEIAVPVPLWALRSSIGALVESIETTEESPQITEAPETFSFPLEDVTDSLVEEAPIPPAAQPLPDPLPAETKVEAAAEPSEPPPAAPDAAPIAPDPNIQFTWNQSRPWQMSSPTIAAPHGNGDKRSAKKQVTAPGKKQVTAPGTKKDTLPDAPAASAPAAPTTAAPDVQTDHKGIPAEQNQDADGAMVWADERFSLATRFQRWLDSDLIHPHGPTDRRGSSRIRSPKMVAYYWSGGFPKAHRIADISGSGICLRLLPDDRWIPETILRMTLQRTDTEEGQPVHSVTVLAEVVRIGTEGVGHRFVMEEALNRHFRDILPFKGTDKQALAKFLLQLQ